MSRPRLDDAQRAQVEATLGHRFTRARLLDRALTHASAVPGRSLALSNERLEFLGDRVLGLAAASHVMDRRSDAQGVLCERLNALVNRDACVRAARFAGLDAVVMTGPSLRADGAGFDSALADAIEAVIGAVYLDAGYEAARDVVCRVWRAAIDVSGSVARDPKTALQEKVQARGLPVPGYRIVRVSGPSHAPLFEVEVDVGGLEVKTTGQGSSRQKAERAAASALLDRLDQQ